MDKAVSFNKMPLATLINWPRYFAGFVVLLVALILATPILTILQSLLQPFNDTWQHIASTVLSEYVSNSLLLVLGVGTGTFLLGVSSAWIISVCEFPGRKILAWALILPLAMPAYIIAYTYTGLLDFSGPVQNAIRQISGLSYGEYYFPEIRSLSGAICMLSLVLYPYVYLLARTAFSSQARSTMDAARSLGMKPLYSFYYIALPMARPAIAVGLSLALMETLADYGTVEYFGVPVLTTGIYRTWFGLGDVISASQLSSILLILVASLLAAEKLARRKSRFEHHGAKMIENRFQLTGKTSIAAQTVCILPVLMGFVIPFMMLSWWAISQATTVFDQSFFNLLFNSLSLATITSVLAVTLALLLAYIARLLPYKFIQSSVMFSGLGYAVPGTVIAVGVMIPFAKLDHWLDNLSMQFGGTGTGLLFSGTLFILVFAYLVRFLAVALGSIQSGLSTITPHMDEAARSLGVSPFHVLKRVHIPILKSSILSAALLVFVDVLKELPATLVLRPFNFNTLAVRTFELASDEQLANAAPTAITIVLIGLLPLILLNRSIQNK